MADDGFIEPAEDVEPDCLVIPALMDLLAYIEAMLDCLPESLS